MWERDIGCMFQFQFRVWLISAVQRSYNLTLTHNDNDQPPCMVWGLPCLLCSKFSISQWLYYYFFFSISIWLDLQILLHTQISIVAHHMIKVSYLEYSNYIVHFTILRNILKSYPPYRDFNDFLWTLCKKLRLAKSLRLCSLQKGIFNRFLGVFRQFFKNIIILCFI